MTTYLGKSCSFCLPRVPFVNCRQFMYLVISLLVLRAGTTTEVPPWNGQYKNTGGLKPVLRAPNRAVSFCHGSKHAKTAFKC